MFGGTVETFSSVLIQWYQANKRDLPWRNTQDPYLIWISEIILQQTRVAQGLDYYLRFVQRFPTVAALAAAPEDDVLKLWQGLGYYSRARNLHAAAKSMGGTFPSTYAGVLALKGVGEYTAAAICSFAYRMPYAVVDGNVYRVLSRVYGISTPVDSTAGKKEFAALAQKLLDKTRPDLFNQAIMEFGALQCVPAGPDCARCPFAKRCKAYAANRVEQLPVKALKTQVKERYFTYIYVEQGGYTWLKKRPAGDVWQGLYEPFLLETPQAVLSAAAVKKAAGQFFEEVFPKNAAFVLAAAPVKHILSHRKIWAQLYKVALPASAPVPPGFALVPGAQVFQYPVSRLVNLLLQKAGLL